MIRVLLLITLFFFSACSTKPVTIQHTLPKTECAYYSLKSAQCQDVEQMVNNITPYKVIFIGDHHTEEDLHQNIAELILALSHKGIKVHLANEWFYPSDEKVLQAYVSTDINETTFIKEIHWKKRLKYYPFDSFKPMYKAVKETQGVLHGINLTREERKKISDQNLSKMSSEELNFYKELDTNVSAHQAMVLPFLSHCHAPKKDESLKECTQRMYRVQVAWDTKMALESYKISKSLKKNEKLLVFAGAMHMENDLGIALRFARLSTTPTVTIIPQVISENQTKHGKGDFIVFYEDRETIKK